MHRSKRWAGGLLIIAGLLFAGCSGSSVGSAIKKTEPVKLERIEGTDLSRVILTKEAVGRLAIQTAGMTEAPIKGSKKVLRKVIHYASLIYDTHGGTWAYINPEPLVFVRQRVAVDFIDGDQVVLLDGPPSGSAVVTVGAAELFGAETGVGK